MGPYEIAVDMTRHVVRVTLRGFWDIATVTRYLTDLQAAATRVSSGRSPSWWLIEMTSSALQSQDVSELMKSKLPTIIPPGATVAVLIVASLQGMQAKRVVSNEHHRHFFTLAEAEHWLADKGMPA